MQSRTWQRERGVAFSSGQQYKIQEAMESIPIATKANLNMQANTKRSNINRV